jgi:PAS domain S-box-containing protein
LVGFVYSPFRAGDLFHEVLGDGPGLFRLRVYDSPGYGESTLLHEQSGSETGGRFESTRTINVAGRTWTLRFESQPAFDTRAHGGRIPLLIFLVGIAATFVLFYFTNGEARARQSAEQTALRLKHSREALRESEERLRLVVDSARDYAILTLDTNGAIVSANSGAEQLYGYEPGELVGRNFGVLFTTEERAAHLPEKKIAQCLETGRAEDDRWITTKGGERRFVSGITRAIRDEFGHVHGLIDVTRDITQRRDAEEAERRASEQLAAHAMNLEHLVAERTAHLQQSIASLEGVLYHVAHDLRAPLRAMHGFTSILLKEYGQHFDDTGKEYARRVSDAAGRMDELIRDLLEYGRLCHMAMPLGKVEVGEPVNRVLGALRDEIEAKHADVQVDASAAPVLANASALETIVANLVTNSLKFVAPSTTPKVRVSTEEHDGVVRLCVKDNGIGIDPQYQDRVFRVFERLHAPERFPGTGIGLAIVQKAAERISAKVGLESKPGHGSTFWVELPKYKERSSTQQAGLPNSAS